MKSEHPAAGRGAVQHSLLNKQASSGGQLEPFPPPSCSEHFFFPTLLLLLLPNGETHEKEGETMGVDFPREIREEREGTSVAHFLSLSYCHFFTCSPKKAHNSSAACYRLLEFQIKYELQRRHQLPASLSPTFCDARAHTFYHSASAVRDEAAHE